MRIRKSRAVARVARRFGGNAAFAKAIGVERSTVSTWLSRRKGHIPDRYYYLILEAAALKGVTVTMDDLTRA